MYHLTHVLVDVRSTSAVPHGLCGRPLRWAGAALFATLLAAGCGSSSEQGDGDTSPPAETPTPPAESPTPAPSPTPVPDESLEIIGTYTDDWGSTHDITGETWTMTMGSDVSLFHITQWSNDDDFLVAQNDSSNAWNPDLWSRFDWTWVDSSLYFCQIAYAAEGEDAALVETSADRADLEAGCGGFGWSRLNPDYGTARVLCAPSSQGSSDPYADCVENYSPGGFMEEMYGFDRFPDVVLGPPEGGGLEEGGTDVLSLGCGGSIVLFFDDPIVVDGPGPDLVVFENPFQTGDTTFAEPGRVSVSEDGETWVTFPCSLDGNATWPPDGCAGVNPVIAGSSDDIDPLDMQSAGGDSFDLADVGVLRARYVRIVDASIAYYGSDTWCLGSTGGFDLDAVALLNTE